MTRFAIRREPPSLSQSFEKLHDVPNLTSLEEDDSQSWEFLEHATMELPIRTKKHSGGYSIELEGEWFSLEQKYIDRHPEFAVHFDEQGRFKHPNLSAATKNIIIGFLRYSKVLKGIKADDVKDTPVLHFIALITFREEMKSIDLPDIKHMALQELARLANDLPFPDILGALMEKEMLRSIEIDSGLMVLLLNRLHAYAPPIPEDEITQVLWKSGGPDLDPSRVVLKAMIDLKLELQDCRDVITNWYAGSRRW
ncbi:hypothetical protein FHETE_2712 [Fusarium heterosporum]|uniref:Uncharacterized protein n=1 Tax=Fusarium heterosporum TaxID=42747 RepID=A0A8H5TRX4_FUSHE|nr:hypothetical protein FHETE_2712 [Fusarium heterosporum]